MLISLTLVSCLGNETTEKPKTDEELIKARIAAFVDSFDDADSTAFLACFDARTRNTMTAPLNLVGGVLGSMILCGLFGFFFMKDSIALCLVIGFLGSIISMFGDLTASIFKRKMGIKDYGNLIPGHGGIMDRFDSILFTAPLVYYAVSFITVHRQI